MLRILFCSILLVMSLGCRPVPGPVAVDLGPIKQKVRGAFPGVPEIGISELVERLDLEEKPEVIDVRSAEEFAVSRIPGARSLPLEELTAQALLGLEIERERSIVFYCSVGYRSAKATKRLRAAGFEKAVNLAGSIFEWANAGHPLEGGNRVHPYDLDWGRYLREEFRAPIPK
ncbi:MAG: rhodanese-like domain-containing protein [Planctomycetota bacterium]|nr:rhodanese-like domain-containing protein [Planctomycetota bacterium]